jgi:tetratricopeptide (TPR) repeat protein
MDIVNKYFKENHKNITFLELKDSALVKIKNFTINKDLPLPIITDNLIEEIYQGNLENEINLSQIIDGIIYLLGVDSDFPNLDRYVEILNSYNPNINAYIYDVAIKKISEGDIEFGGIFLRALIYLDSKNLNVRFNYALVLEEMGRKYIESNDEKGEEFLTASTNELESIVEMDEKYSLAYYKLGFHHKYFEQYIKAKLTWNKFLTVDKDENRLQEIREEIDLIDDNVKFETGLTYLTYNEFGKALDSFLKLLPRYGDEWNVLYLLAMCYKGLSESDKAIEYLHKAIEINDEEPDLYNELGIINFLDGKIIEAIGIFNEGIEKTDHDYKLYFNRGLGYIQLGEYNLALKDVKMAYELNPKDENVVNQLKELEDLMSSI